jgi:hypothetical protein
MQLTWRQQWPPCGILRNQEKTRPCLLKANLPCVFYNWQLSPSSSLVIGSCVFNSNPWQSILYPAVMELVRATSNLSCHMSFQTYMYHISYYTTP